MKHNLCTSRITSSHHYKQGRILELSFPGYWKQLLKFCDALEEDVSTPIRIKSINFYQIGTNKFNKRQITVYHIFNLEKKETKTKVWVPVQAFELYKLVPKFYISECINSIAHICGYCGGFKANKAYVSCSSCMWFHSLDQILYAEELKEQYRNNQSKGSNE